MSRRSAVLNLFVPTVFSALFAVETEPELISVFLSGPTRSERVEINLLGFARVVRGVAGNRTFAVDPIRYRLSLLCRGKTELNRFLIVRGELISAVLTVIALPLSVIPPLLAILSR